MELRFPTVLDVDDGQSIVQRVKGHASPAGVLKKFARSLGELVYREIFSLARSLIGEPGLECVEERGGAGVAGFAQRIGSATTRAGDA